MKYYWLVYSFNNPGCTRTYSEQVTIEHPFTFMEMERGEYGRSVMHNITLENWKEITKKEYEMFK